MNYFISMLSTTGGKMKVSPKEILTNYNKIKKINPKKKFELEFEIKKKKIETVGEQVQLDRWRANVGLHTSVGFPIGSQREGPVVPSH